MGWLRRLALLSALLCCSVPAYAQSDFGRTIVRNLKGPAVASASTITPLSNYDVFPVTGTTTINYITTTGYLPGRRIVLVFAGALTVTHNAGSVPANTAPVLVRNATNLTTAANLALALVYDGSNWIDEGNASGGAAGGAPTDAQYVVGAANGTLSAERVLTDTATLAWDLATAGQAKASIVAASVTYAMLQNVSAQHKCLGRVSASAGPVEEFDCTAAGRALLDDAAASDQRNTLGLGTIATQNASAVAITGGTAALDAVGGLGIKDTDSSHKLVLQAGSNLGADRILTLTTGDSARTLTLNGDTTLSGTNTGDQTITLTSDVTGSGTGSFATTIANNAVTFAKMADIATDRLIGRDTAATGDPEAISVGGGLEFSGSTSIQRSALSGDVSASAGSNTLTIGNDIVTYAKMQNISATDRLLCRDTASAGDAEECTVGGGLEFTGSVGIQRSALTGDVTASAGNNATTIANDAVTFAKFQNITDARLLGRSAGSSGDMQEITVGSGLSLSAGALTGTLDINGLTATTVFSPYDDQIPIYDSSASANRKITWEDFNDGRSWVDVSDEFLSDGPYTSGSRWNHVTISIGAGTMSASTAGDGNTPGILTIATASGATDALGLLGQTSAYLFGGGRAKFNIVVAIPTLSTSAQRFTTRVGWGDSASAEPTDGCYFRQVDAVNSDEWQGVCRSNSAETTCDTNTLPVASTFQNLAAEVNAAGTSVEFFIDGTSKCTVASNIPTSGGRQFGLMPITMIKSVGTTSRTVYIDYYRYLFEFTTAR